MRIIVAFLLGFISAFYLIDFLTRVFRRPISGFIGLAVFIFGWLVTFLGQTYLDPAMSVLLGIFLVGAGIGMMTYHLLSQQYIFFKDREQRFIRKHEKAVERFLEILPGALTWLAITSPIWLSFTFPFAVAYIIILADVYWLYTSIRISVLVYIGYKNMKQAARIHWLDRLKKDFPNDWDNYYQLVVLPTYKESSEVLAPAFEAVANSSYPKNKIFFAVGFEAWASPEQVQGIIKYLDKYRSSLNILTTVHELQPGELKGPGTNRNCMIRNAAKEFKKLGIDPKKVLVTTLDADFVIHKEFLSGALHKYLSTPENERDKRSYTGVFLYNNNYWQAPTPMRLMAAGTAYWQLSEMVGSDKYINFASMSLNMQSLLDVGLWIPNKVNDDSGFFWKAYYHFKGDYRVLPHFLPLSADANLDTSLLKTFKNTYLQLKRWAYGVEHIPFIFTEYFTRQDINFWDKTDKLTFILWSYFKWGTLALFITFGGLLIPIANPHFSQSVLSVNLSTISSWILDGAFLGLFSTIYVHEKTVPKRPKSWGPIKRFWSFAQWVLVPIILVTIATVPAIDAQTSLMFGRYLEFRVTNKARVKA